MTLRIRELLEEIREREEEMEELLKENQDNILYRLEGTKVKFEREIVQAHRKLKVGLVRWLRNARPSNVLTAPFIYSMIVPFLLLDLSVSLYQWICFPIYKIASVKRDKYIVIDRHKLAYLNSIEKFNCVYCGYANGLIAYVQEITARTEQFWCPIKHARKVLNTHHRYQQFAEFGDSEGYHDHVVNMRDALKSEKLAD